MTSVDVNRYLQAATGADVTTRDFRIWAGTVIAYRALSGLEPATDPRGARHNVIEAVRISAGQLGNTEAVARHSYVHPAVLEAYLDGAIAPPEGRGEATDAVPPILSVSDPAAEAAVLRLLHRRLEA